MTKVSIPAYKLRGESAILECIYELHRPDGPNHDSDNDNDDELTYSSNSRYNSIVGGDSGGNPNTHHDDGYTNYGNNKNLYRRIRSYTQPQQQQHRNYHQSHYQYQQYQPKQQHQNPNQQQPPPLQLQSQTQPSSITSYGFQHDHHLQQQQHKQQQQHYSYENSNEKYDDDGGGGVARVAGGVDEHHSNYGESLYAVKWYKDNEEFYRYVPKANPQKQSYRVDGVRVIVSKIAHHIYIINIFYTFSIHIQNTLPY